MTLVKGNLRIGVHTRFGPNWPGKRCLAKTRRAQPVRGPHTSTMGAVRCTVAGQLDHMIGSADQRIPLNI